MDEDASFHKALCMILIKAYKMNKIFAFMGVLELGLTCLQDLIIESNIQEFCEHWWLGTGHGGNIYTMKIGKHYESVLAFIWDLVYQHTNRCNIWEETFQD